MKFVLSLFLQVTPVSVSPYVCQLVFELPDEAKKQKHVSVGYRTASVSFCFPFFSVYKICPFINKT